MDKHSLLNILLWLPLLAAVVVWLLPENQQHNDDKSNLPKASLAINFSLAVFLIELIFVLIFWCSFESSDDMQFATIIPWIKSWGVSYHIALNGINLILILLTTIIFPLATLFIASQIKNHIRLFCASLLFIQFAVIGALLAQDLFLFYIFWEAMLIPAFIFIIVWGDEKKLSALYRFFLFTAFGSILMLAGIIFLGYQTYQSQNAISFAYSSLYRLDLPINTQLWLFAAFGIAFAIKLPLFPFHAWQAITYRHSPLIATIIFAAVLSKVGGYGLIVLAFPLFPLAVQTLTPLLLLLAVVGIIYGALVAFSQNNIKSLLAYSSLSHLGFVLLGLTSFNALATNGVVIHMFSHGITVAGLFIMVAILSRHFATDEINKFGGLTQIMPSFAVFFVIFSLTAVGLPTTSGFVGEFFVLLGAINSSFNFYITSNNPIHLVLVCLAVLGVIFSAMYMLKLCQNILFGNIKTPLDNNSDNANSNLPTSPTSPTNNIKLNFTEKLALSIITLAIFVIGLYPQVLFNKSDDAVHQYIYKIQLKDK